MDGYDATRALHAIPHRTDVPVVFMTALTQPAERALACEAGGHGLIEKPFDALSLGDQILNLIESTEGDCNAANSDR